MVERLKFSFIFNLSSFLVVGMLFHEDLVGNSSTTAPNLNLGCKGTGLL